MPAIRVELELADGTFTTRMLRAGQTVEQFNASVAKSTPALAGMANAGANVIRSVEGADKTSRSFLGTLRDVAIVAGTISIAFHKLIDIQNSWVGDLIRTNIQFERLLYQMRSMSTSTDPIADAGNQVAYLRKMAMEVPFSLKSLNDAFVKLKATGIDPLNGSLKAVTDGVAAFGGSDESLERIVLGLSQMAGKGVIQMEELRQQLGEQMPTAVAIMARSMGVSMGQLIKDISTGTVQAKPALAAFFAEIDRAYGGRAQYMMQTFTGQLQRMNTEFQTLALTAGGVDLTTGISKSGGLMDTLRNQLRDITNLLDSKAGVTLAEQIGQAMTTAVRWIRTGIDTIIQFRSEIYQTGRAMALAFVGTKLVSGTSNIIGYLQTMRLEWTKTKVALQGASSAFSIMNQAMANGAPMLTVFTHGWAALRLGVIPVVAGLATFAPIIAGIGVAVVAAAQYFGIFSNKVEDAYQELVKYGAESRRQVLEHSEPKKKQLQDEIAALNASRSDLQKQIDDQKQRIAAAGEGSENQRILKERLAHDLDLLDDFNGKIDEKNKELARVQQTVAEIYDETGREEDRKAVSRYMDRVNEEIQSAKTLYNIRSNNLQEQYDKEEKLAAKNGQSVVKIREERAKELKKVQLQEYDDEIAILRKSLASQEQIFLRSTDDAVTKRSGAIIASLQEQINTLLTSRSSLMAMDAGTPMMEKAFDDKKAIDRAKTKLNSLQADVEGLKADLMGANGEVVRLKEILKDPIKFGVGDSIEELTKLKDQLIAAQAEKEKLDKLLAGKKKLEGDIKSAMDDARNRIDAAQHIIDDADKLGKGDIIERRIKDGFYEGFGPKSQVMEWLDNILKAYNAQGDALNQIGDVARENTFGNQTIMRIDSTADALGRVAKQLTAIGYGLNGLDWNKMNFSGDGLLPGGAMRQDWSKFGGGILDLIAKVESGGDYNATLDNGQWTGGAQNLIGMTLNQVRDLQRRMLANPANRAKYGGIGSSALGRYQIVGDTLDGLMKEMGLSGNELYDERMQDEMAKRLLARRGANPAALRQEWQGLRNVDDSTIMRALGSSEGPGPRANAAAGAYAQVPTYQVSEVYKQWEQANANFKAKVEKDLKELKSLEATATDKEHQAAQVKAREKLVAIIDDEKKGLTKVNSLEREITEEIKKGNLGKSKDPQADEYKEIIKLAKEADEAKKRMKERDKNSNNINNFEEERLRKQIELQRRLDEAKARIKDPDELKSSAGFRQLEREYDQYLSWIEANSGRESKAYKDALVAKKEALVNLRNVEVTEATAGWTQRTREINRSFMTEGQRRQDALQQEINRIDAEVAAFNGSEQEKLAIVAAAEKQKAALRRQAAEAGNPISAQMREWGDLQGNLAKASTQWMDSLAGGLTDLIMGTGDLRSVIQGILKDVINMGIKYLMSQMMGAKSQASGALGRGGKKGSSMGASAKGGSKKGAFPMAPAIGLYHTGGIVGGMAGSYKRIDPRVFNNAPKFHGGGVIGSRHLSADEVPIIAKRNEGVFTPEQMAGMGNFGGQAIQINAPVTVNGSAGTPQQNTDLAKKMKKEMESSMRGVVADEIRRQLKPGNMLNSKGINH